MRRTSTIRARQGACTTTVAVTQGDANVPEDFLQLMARMGSDRDEATALVEACTGHAFNTCTRAEFVALFEQLLAVARRVQGSQPESLCGD